MPKTIQFEEAPINITITLPPQRTRTIVPINTFHWFGVPPGRRLTAWEKRRRNLGIAHDCGCVSDDVDNCYKTWYDNEDKRPLEERIANKNKGACDIIKKHFEYLNEYTPEAIEVLVEFMVFTMNKDDKDYQPTFLQKRYNLTWDEAMVILEHVNKERWFSHGSGARCSWVEDEGKEWLAEHATPEQQDEIMRNLEPWLEMTDLALR